MNLQKTHQGLAEKNINMILMISDLKGRITSQQYHLANFYERNDPHSLYFIEQNNKHITKILRELFDFDLTQEEYHWLNVINKSYESSKINVISLTAYYSGDKETLRNAYTTSINTMSVAINFSDQLTGILHNDYERKRIENDQKFTHSIAITSIGALVALVSSFYFFGFLSQRLEELEIQGTKDGLTGIYNKKTITTIMELLIKNNRNEQNGLSAAFLDIDHFKTVNDRYGHLAGDMILRDLALIIQKSIRSKDFCGRFGGEEFLILLTNTNAKESWLACERIRRAIESTDFLIDDNCIKISVTIGLAFAKTRDSTDGLIRRADQQLYQGKKNGRNRTESESFFEEDQNNTGGPTGKTRCFTFFDHTEFKAVNPIIKE